MNDLTRYNTREYKAKLAQQSERAKREQSEVWRASSAYKLSQEIEALEERLGIDGVRPSEKGRFEPRGVFGTTSYSAFKKPTIRVLDDGSHENIME